jgi:ABC-type transporter Mla MlaB component
VRKHVTLIERKADAMKAGKSPKRARATSPPEEVVATAQESSQPAVPVADVAAKQEQVRKAVVLLAECTVRNAMALRTSLLDSLDAPGSVDVEVGAVERVDTACLQLLLAFVRERSQHGRSTAWRGRSDVLEQATTLLGLGGTLAISGAA